MTKGKSRGSSKKPPAPQRNLLRESQFWGSLLILLGVFSLLMLLSPNQGVITTWWTGQLRAGVGDAVILLPLLLIGLGLWAVLRGIGKLKTASRLRPIGALLLFLVFVIALHMAIGGDNPQAVALDGRGGGALGYALSDLLQEALGQGTAWIILMLTAVAATVLLAGPLMLSTLTMAGVWIVQRRDDRLLRHPPTEGLQPSLPSGPSAASGKPLLWRNLIDWLRGDRRAGLEVDDQPTLLIGGNGARGGETQAAGRPPRVIGSPPVATAAQTAAGQSHGPLSPQSAANLIPRIIGGSRSWRLPNLTEILDDAAEVEISRDEIRERARIIEQTLADFGLPVRVVEANQGPAVTQYGLQPGYRQRRKTTDEVRREAEELLKQRGYGSPRRPITDELLKQVMDEEVERYERVKIKVSKIQALTNDLALALSASPIRIEAPVPGRPLVGIEVPNVQKAMVSLRGVLESDTFRQMESPLKIALGQDTAGQPAVADLGRMPHLLVAGATGSGKSVCINAVITTLLLTHTPDTLRFLMIDPKMVELTTFNGIPHLLAPVVVELERVVPLLSWATGEMDRRYKLFAKAGARNLEAYNEKLVAKGEPILPYIIVVIDELADLMMAAPDDVERYVCRLAQMARATGIHLIIATQRPSVDVVTGLIKANFPSRVAFAVTSQVDSRVILDVPGAEALLGRGDMLFMRPDSSKLERLQGCFVSDAELERLVRYWKGVRVTEEGEAGQASLPESSPPAPEQDLPPWEPAAYPRPQDVVQAPFWDELIEQQRQAEANDTLYEDAVKVVRQAGRASVSLLQRRLRIGYSRAARLIDLLEERGVIGPDLGSGRGRDVLSAAGADADWSGPASSPGPDRPDATRPPRVWS